MARIRKTQDWEGGLFPPMGLVRVSAMLYDRLKRRIEIRLGKKLKGLTADALMERYWKRSEQVSVIGISPWVLSMAILKKDFEIAVTVFAIDRIYTTVWLHFPIAGQVSHMDEFIGLIVKEHDLTNQVRIIGGKLEMKFQLCDGDEPKLDPRYQPDAYGRKMYSCASEVWKYERERRNKVR
jgi:hypothetical protein